jgi:DMSO/TMAO reductase YedYZ molybdopterin-dependent catalytic subunit
MRTPTEHGEPTRRHLLGLSGAVAAWGAAPGAAESAADPRLREAIAKLEYLTPIERAYILDKGKAGVAKLPPEKVAEAGLTQETWTLEVVAEPGGGSKVARPLSRASGNALDWAGLMRLAAKHAVRFIHTGVCTNGADPFHVAHWEGIPLREVVWMAQPQEQVRRVYYQSYHAPGLAPFQASMPLGQVLETPPGQMPAILAYKMNGQWIPPTHGGPVRVIVPGTYGSKSIKWVQRILLTNDYRANDSDAAEFNNDAESAMKTRARFIHAPTEAKAGEPFAITGMAQVGVSGIGRVQYCVEPQGRVKPDADPYRNGAQWQDANILPPPASWGGGLTRMPPGTSGFDPSTGAPLAWPMRFAIVHWAALQGGLAPGAYDLCCRTVDGNGIAQPLPRPLLRTGFNTIHRVALVVKSA